MTLREFDRLDPSERDYWIADWQIERGKCASCGNPISECSDPEKKWYPQRVVCYATMERKAAVARYEDLHKDAPFHDGAFKNWAAKWSLGTPYHLSDGVSIIATPTDYAPDDDFLRPAASDLAPDEPGPGEDGED